MRSAPALQRVNAAIRLRQQGQVAESAALLRGILADEPATGAAYHELAVLAREEGRLAEAASLLETGLNRAGEDSRARLFLAQARYGLGDFSGGDVALSPLPESPARAAMAQFGAYLRRFPLSRALDLLFRLKSRNRYLDTEQTVDVLHAALREHAPFALVRLGDGEGAWMNLGPADEARFAALYAANRAEVTAIWFGAAFDPAAGFSATAFTLPLELSACDLTGIPYTSWLRHEYAIASPRGVPSLVNLLRRLLELPPGETDLCRQLINLYLYMDGHFPALLRSTSRVSVITCHEGLAGWVQSEFGLTGVEWLRVPGEHGAAALLGAEALAGAHFPTRFAELQDQLASAEPGRLYLVAAGILGKFYAASIRRAGGIAIDIGSLADMWLGLATRPGLAGLTIGR